MDYLVFRLYGPMASWGEIAIGESRHSADYPSKSAITGLLAAALGIRREEESVHHNLSKCYLQAVKVRRSGWLLRDYHTAQAPDSAGKFRYRTRRDEIVTGRDRLGTVLSSREYRSDADALVAVRALGTALYSLTNLADALMKPKFHLYLGRKSCALAAPLNPLVIQADNFHSALENYEVKPVLKPIPEWASDSRWLPQDQLLRFYWEGDMAEFFPADTNMDKSSVQRLSRYDMPLSRKRWQFEPRQEYLWTTERRIG